MAFEPINYTAAQPQPDFLKSILGGLQVGATVQAQQAQQAQQEAAMQRQQAYQDAIRNAMSAPSPQAFAALALQFPEHREAFKQGWEQLSADQQQNELRDASGVAASLQAGRTDVAAATLERRITAMKNSGQDPGALPMILDLVKTDPQRAYGAVLSSISALPGGDKYIEGLGKLGVERRADQLQGSAVKKAEADAAGAQADAAMKQAKVPYAEGIAASEATKASAEATDAAAKAQLAPEQYAANLGLTRAQTTQAMVLAKKYGAETQKVLMDLAGGMDPSKSFEAEAKLRAEYVNGTKGYTDVTEGYRRVKAASDNAQGDLSLIYGYMKMLDPGSVVREGEFATAQNAAGVPDRVRNLWNRAIDGERLNDSQRKMFKAEAGKVYEAASKREQEVRSGLERVVSAYKLNPKNVFGGAINESVNDPGAGRPPLSSFDKK